MSKYRKLNTEKLNSYIDKFKECNNKNFIKGWNACAEIVNDYLLMKDKLNDQDYVGITSWLELFYVADVRGKEIKFEHIVNMCKQLFGEDIANKIDWNRCLEAY